MAKAVASALRDAGFAEGIIVARNEQAGRHLADVCGYRWLPELGDLCPPMLVNVTPIGMAGGQEADQLAFPSMPSRPSGCSMWWRCRRRRR
jgi:shikimate dehydrogenase